MQDPLFAVWRNKIQNDLRTGQQIAKNVLKQNFKSTITQGDGLLVMVK